METLQLGRDKHQVPSTWNELTRRQLLRVLPELVAKRPGQRLRLLSLLSGFALPRLAVQGEVVLSQLLPLTDFLFSEEHHLTEQLLPTVRPHWLLPDYHGPRSHFRNLTFGEFIFADTFFVLYHQHQDAQYLDKFLAVLYRPRLRGVRTLHHTYGGDVREPFNEHLLPHRASILRRISRPEKAAILAWYRGCRAQLQAEFPAVFDAGEEDAKEQKRQAPDWGRVLRKLSGGAFGTVQQTSGQPLRLLMAELHDAAEDYEKRKSIK
ncbi:hypothetical protein HER32_06605 [Hymenobacter sp. BT18]|uniref:hypothetical protein n=1 Tax=Hymenobacter sp. BT18 TaxID=2835648 RepID=UPI00143E21C0|nr:hypothetical protein [Hymenobacter sp. BT18]QIX60863.1 hypothetical protein HER32_06605 [Hymenobacter sp. BT18]